MQKMRQGDWSQTSFCFLKNLYSEVVCSLVSIDFDISIALNLSYKKKKIKLYETLDYCSRDMLNFDILENGLGIVSPRHFVHDFSRKIFSCYLLLSQQISLPYCFYFLRYCAIHLLTRM